jgi:hypothetical protein
MRSFCAVLVVIATLVAAGCGGSSDKPAVATATTATTPSTVDGKPARLSTAQQARADRAVTRILSAITLYQSKLNACVPDKTKRKACVKRVVRPAERVVASAHKTLNALGKATGGGCSNAVQALSDQLDSLTEDLRAETVAASSGDAGAFTQVGAGVQQDLRTFAAASQEVPKTCA